MIRIKHFTATWCQPCKQLSPIMRELSSQNPTVGYQIIDIDDNIGIAQEYGVRAVPTIVFEKNGLVVQTVIGVQPKSYYQSLIDSL
jgi:thioredoxin 1